MFLFAHTGITAGMVKLADVTFPYRAIPEEKHGFRGTGARMMNRLRDREGNIDYRIVFIGSMLPDIIDKPLAVIFDNPVIFSGRGLSHTLLFLLILLIFSGVFRRVWLFLLTLGTVFHLLLDSIWEMPETLFWPFMGGFITENPENWALTMWEYLVSKPDIFIPEMIGIIILAWLAFRVMQGKSIIRFIKNGMIP